MVEKVTNCGDRLGSGTMEWKNNDIELNLVRNKLQSFQTSILKDVEKRMSIMIDEVLQDIRQHKLQTDEFKNFAYKTQQKQNEKNTWSNRIETDVDKLKEICDEMTDTIDSCTSNSSTTHSDDQQSSEKRKKRTLALPNKIFVVRESYLTALLKVDHMKTIYHIFYIILLMLFMNCICYDYFVEGRINFGLGTFKAGLTGIHYVLGVWCVEHLVVFTLFYAFKGWAHVRSKLLNQKSLLKFWTHSCLIAYVSSQLLFGFVASALCIKLDLPFITASVLLLESTRLLMKMHAFVRFNAERVVAGKLKADMDLSPNDTRSDSNDLPTFSTYLYFLFAPTLIYRDYYPRTSQIRWQFAFARFMEVVATAFLYSYIYESHIKVHFYNYGKEPLNASTLIVKLFGMIMPSTIIFLCGFYMILHSWLNFTSELLRFGDRMFYKDWWTTSTYDAYYRNWNVVVHDWLYEYIYKDFYVHILKGSKIGASLTVFLVSALVHEHIIGFALQVFFPVIFTFFGVIGLALVFISRSFPKNIGNIFIWFSLIFGNGLMFSLYSMEYFARYNCPYEPTSILDYVVPRIWNCYNN